MDAHPSQLDGCTAARESEHSSFPSDGGTCVVNSKYLPSDGGTCVAVSMYLEPFLGLGGRRVLLIKAGCDRCAIRGLDQPSSMTGQR